MIESKVGSDFKAFRKDKKCVENEAYNRPT